MTRLLSRNVGSADAPLKLGEALQMLAVTLIATPALLWLGAMLRSL
jgi:hypothetical protein